MICNTVHIGRVIHSFVKYLYRFMMTKENKKYGNHKKQGGLRKQCLYPSITPYQRITLLGKYSSMSSM